MAHRSFFRPLAAALALTITLTSAASALTPQQAAELLTDYYIDSIPHSVLEQPTVQQMVEALGDPYTQYLTAEEYGQFLGSMTDTNLVGVGIYGLMTQEGLLLQRVYEDTPAALGGLKPGDLIVAVDGQSVTGEQVYQASALLQGVEGSQVQVSYLRDGAACTAVLTRQAVTIPTTYTELWDGHIGYIDCDAFGAETLDHFLEGIETYGDVADHWIVDLQANGGGEVDAAMSASSCFTGPCLMAYLQDSTGGATSYGGNLDQQTPYPALVLLDGGSASASELFAAAIRDNNAGILIGGRTYGKGVAQVVLDQSSHPNYFPDGDALKVTTYRIYSGVGSTADTIGLLPHLLVDPDIAAQVAVLLTGASPTSSTAGTLRIDFGWRWYVDLDTALSEEFQPVFTALLEALPETVRVLEGTGGTSWADTTPADLAAKYALTDYTPRTFSDIGDSPYRQQIQHLATYQVLQGDGSGTFLPHQGLTRAQLCALLAQVLHCAPYTGISRFSDVPDDSWYASAVNSMAQMGLVEGVGGGRFNPDAPVSHEQFITIMGRLGQRLNLFLFLAADEVEEAALADPDLAGYADWARESVWLLSESQQSLMGNAVNLLWAPLSDIDPAADATREEAAALTCTLLDYIGILPG